MVKRIGGNRRKTRNKLKRPISEKGKINITRYLQKFNEGDKVTLKVDPSVHEGMYFPRFHGKSATITKQRGRCYEVLVKDANKQKTLIVHPAHMLRR